MSNSISSVGNNSYVSLLNTQAMQQRNDDLFSKLDSNSDSGIDKTEFSDFAKKLSENTGSSLNVDDVFSTYDADSDGTLSSDELKTFMKDNPPPPPPQMQKAMSAYGTDQSSDPMSTLLDLLTNLSASNGSASSGDTGSLSTYLSKLIENLSSGASSSLIDVTT
ncbi:MAG: EF-hand domain-containing protein [Desulfobacterales bacterium]